MTPGQRRYDLAGAYRKASRGLGADHCPIEAGLMGRLADNECRHGNLPTDERVDCSCWKALR